MLSDGLMGRGKGKLGSRVGKPGKGKSNVEKSGKVNMLAEKLLLQFYVKSNFNTFLMHESIFNKM